MCNPVAMFAVNTAGAIGQHQSQKAQVNARNRAKLANFDAENSAYLRDVTLGNASYRDKVVQQEVKLDQIFKGASEKWQEQDMLMEEVYTKHAFNVQDIMIGKAKASYAGTQTGRTAARLAAEPSRAAGMAMAKSVRDVVLNSRKVQLNKEIIANDADRRSRSQWEQVRQAPVPGHTPVAPQLEAGPGIGGLLLNIAAAAVGAYMQSQQLKTMRGIQESTRQGLLNQQNTLPSYTSATQRASLQIPDASFYNSPLNNITNWNRTGTSFSTMPTTFLKPPTDYWTDTGSFNFAQNIGFS